MGTDRRTMTRIHRSQQALPLAGLLLAAALACGPADPEAPEPAASAFVGTAACGECHAEQHARWQGSHHDRAMQRASPESVLGDFDDARFDQFPVSTRFFRRDGRYFVHTEGPDGVPADFEIAYTFGVDPLQQLLVEFPGGRLQSLTIAWDVAGERWFSLYPDERIPPGDPLHWTGRFQRWNSMCADCHSTQLKRGYDLANDRYDTTWEALDVGCEACHGPGRAHVERVHSGAAVEGDMAMVLAADATETAARIEIETCAPCHSRRHRLVESATIGAPFLDGYMPELLLPGLYHADGQVDGEVYVYGSFLQSAMYHAGVRCSDCHDPHSAKLRAEGNALCLQCHGPEPDPRFPTASRSDFDSPDHHFHPTGSAGAQCVACHMPSKNFMQIDSRRDHSLRVPRPDLAAAIGGPDACTACHDDRSAQWAAEAVAGWYGPDRRQGPHYGATFAAAAAGVRGIETSLIALAGDPDQAAIVRATALDWLSPAAGAPPVTVAIGEATRDPEALVRAVAVGALDRAPLDQRILIATPLLEDPIRAVRVEAGRVLAAAPPERFDESRRAALAAAIAEYEAAQLALADTAAAHLNLAVLSEDRGDPEAAEEFYRTALRIGPDFLPAHFNLANFLNRNGRNADAERTLRAALERFPEEGELHYSLGLLLAEEERLDEAVVALQAAAERLPRRARVQLNLGLAYQHLEMRDEARAALERAYAIDPGEPSVLNALAIYFVQERDWERAAEFARKLVRAVPPGTPGPEDLVRRIESEIAAEAARGAR